MNMAVRPKARAAFTEMIWSRLLEHNAHERRWPTRRSPHDWPAGHRMSIGADFAFGRLSFSGPAVSGRAKRWLAYHAITLAARVAWDSAVRRAQTSIDARWADWSRDGETLNARIIWYCRARGKHLQFAGYMRDLQSESFSGQMRNKAQRQYAFDLARSAPRQRLDALVHHDCLGWTRRDGWQVCGGARPDGDDIRHVRLLHVGLRTNCWIYRSREGHFVARLTQGIIQVSGRCASEALDGLRSALVQYRRTFDANHATGSRPTVRRVKLTPAAATVVRESILRANETCRARDFWQTTSTGMETRAPAFPDPPDRRGRVARGRVCAGWWPLKFTARARLGLWRAGAAHAFPDIARPWRPADEAGRCARGGRCVRRPASTESIKFTCQVASLLLVRAVPSAAQGPRPRGSPHDKFHYHGANKLPASRGRRNQGGPRGLGGGAASNWSGRSHLNCLS